MNRFETLTEQMKQAQRITEQLKEEVMVLYNLLTFGRKQYVIEHMLNFKMGS